MAFSINLYFSLKATVNAKIRKKYVAFPVVKKLPVVFINEHCSTIEAKEKFFLKKDKTGKIDSAAAAILLQQWLIEGPNLDDSN